MHLYRNFFLGHLSDASKNNKKKRKLPASNEKKEKKRVLINFFLQIACHNEAELKMDNPICKRKKLTLFSLWRMAIHATLPFYAKTNSSNNKTNDYMNDRLEKKTKSSGNRMVRVKSVPAAIQCNLCIKSVCNSFRQTQVL